VLGTLIKPVYLDLRNLVLRTLVRPGPPPTIPGTIRSLLVISDGRLGDVCLAIPVLQCLRAAYPDASLGIVTPRRLQPLVQWACQPNCLFELDNSSALASTHWDIVIDLTTDYHLKPARLAAATDSRVRIGFEFKGRGRYFNLPLTLAEREHMQETYARVLSPLGIQFRRIPLPAMIPAEALTGKNHSIAVHPGAHFQTQRWPSEYIAQLIRRIHDGGEFCLVLGSQEESALVDVIVRASGPGAIGAITNDVMQLAQAIRASQILICNNSGPLHLAGLLGVPTLSFMGPTVKARWSPLGPHAVVLRQDNLPCIGCNLGYCRIRTRACMKEIGPDEAFAAYSRLRRRILPDSSI